MLNVIYIKKQQYEVFFMLISWGESYVFVWWVLIMCLHINVWIVAYNPHRISLSENIVKS